MSCDYFPIKLGDTDPPFEVILKNGTTAVDLTGVTDVRVAYRRQPGGVLILEKEAVVVDPANQDPADPDRGRIRHGWVESDTDDLFGDPAPTTDVVVVLAEVELIRDGKTVTWPTEGWIEVRVIRDIVPDESS